MKDNSTNITNPQKGIIANSIELQQKFSEVYNIILTHKERVANTIDKESLSMIWNVGAYVSNKLELAEWGSGVVRQLSEYIRTKDPTIRGWSYRTIYKMAQFYDTYSNTDFLDFLQSNELFFNLEKNNKKLSKFTPIKVEEVDLIGIVPFEMAQMPNILYSTGWTNHQLILSHCKTNAERLFYMLYAGHENLKNKELARAIKTDTMTSMLAREKLQTETLKNVYPQTQILFKDTAYLDFLGLPQTYKESRLRKDIVTHMKDFILELGKDFLFVDQEHKVTVGTKDFKIDLLFYHRILQCLVAFELKTTEFQPAYLGQLEFYLEALDNEERRSNENPTIGILFCKESDQDIVRFALNRSMSPLMIMQYKEQLKVGSVIQRSLVEFCKMLDNEHPK